MTKQELIDLFDRNHRAFAEYIRSLPEDRYAYGRDGKWSAGQQLAHVYLCLVPMEKALGSKEFILQKFGKIDRPVLGYDLIVDHYLTALAQGGKAPERFVPDASAGADKAGLSAGLRELLDRIRQQYEGYTDEELDTLVLPHPLLGPLTVREMFYLMAYHATHHHRQTERNLAP